MQYFLQRFDMSARYLIENYSCLEYIFQFFFGMKYEVKNIIQVLSAILTTLAR